MFLIALTSSAELIYQFEDQQQEDRFYRLIKPISPIPKVIVEEWKKVK